MTATFTPNFTEIPAPNPVEALAPKLTLNSVNLVGRAGSNPEVKYFESGTVKATLSMAVRRPTKNNDPDWVNIELWGNTAEIAANYLRKGDLFGISGYLKIETWVDRNSGCERSKPVVKADKIYLLGGKRSDDEEHEEVF